MLSELTEQERMWLQKYAAQWAEADGVPEEVCTWIRQRGWFKLFVPAVWGGREAKLSQAVRLYEELAELDGSVAWLVQIGAGGGFFVPSFEPEVAARLFSPPEAVIAGSGAVSGRARRVAGGYYLSGRWRFASGAQYATVFTANAWVEEEQMVRAFALFREQVRLERDWRAFGMRATSSWSFAVQEVFVPEAYSFVVGQKRWEPELAVYHLPFEFFAAASIGAVALGLAVAFGRELSRRGGEGVVWRWGLMEAARQLFHEAVAQGEEAAVERRAAERLRQAGRLVRAAVAIVRRTLCEMLPQAGMAAVLEGEGLGRIVRDFLTVCQHPMVCRERAG